MENRFYTAIGIDPQNKSELNIFQKNTGVSKKKLDYYNNNNTFPTGKDLENILKELGKSEIELKLAMGIIDQQLASLIAANAKSIAACLPQNNEFQEPQKPELEKVLQTELGILYKGDCIDLMKSMESESVDLIFADPPFNLDKFYLSNINDKLSDLDYLKWSEEWLFQCARILKQGGGLFVYNLPRWNKNYADFLDNYLTFRHWVAVDIKFSLPIQGKLYPSHYSLIYYTKGEKPTEFHPDRMPMEICPKCYADLKDYGGYKNKMNPKGINLTDVWYDIPPVRHSKYKKRKEANELSVKLLDRIIELGSKPNDIIFDPFGGSGTTYAVAEAKGRKWIGVELGPVEAIIERFTDIDSDRKLISKYRENYNSLFPDKVKKQRMQLNLWTDESFIKEVKEA
jgi:site-specific DNA-methyltransferase (adenine-specific)